MKDWLSWAVERWPVVGIGLLIAGCWLIFIVTVWKQGWLS